MTVVVEVPPRAVTVEVTVLVSVRVLAGPGMTDVTVLDSVMVVLGPETSEVIVTVLPGT